MIGKQESGVRCQVSANARKFQVFGGQCSVWRLIGVCVVASAMCAGVARGGVVGEMHDWDPYPGDGGWASSNGWVNLATNATGGVTNSGFLSVTFPEVPDGAPGDDGWQELIYTPATSLFAGTYSVSNWFQFDFWASNVLPNAVQVRWQSSTNSRIWGSLVSGPTATGEWQTLTSVGLGSYSDWEIDGFASQGEFLSDLTDIEWIGLYIDRNTAVEQMYGVDNFALMIPEPAELIMLAAALTAVWMAYRRKEQNA